jgi:hypothetical protein
MRWTMLLGDAGMNGVEVYGRQGGLCVVACAGEEPLKHMRHYAQSRSREAQDKRTISIVWCEMEAEEPGI